jgi:hypothetical protein
MSETEKRYFKLDPADLEEGEGIEYLEFEGDFCTRQIENYNEQWRCYQQKRGALDTAMCDQPLHALDFPPEFEITSSEFEDAWRNCMNQS